MSATAKGRRRMLMVVEEEEKEEAVLRSKRREVLWKVDVGDEYLKRTCDWLEFRSRGWACW